MSGNTLLVTRILGWGFLYFNIGFFTTAWLIGRTKTKNEIPQDIVPILVVIWPFSIVMVFYYKLWDRLTSEKKDRTPL